MQVKVDLIVEIVYEFTPSTLALKHLNKGLPLISYDLPNKETCNSVVDVFLPFHCLLLTHHLWLVCISASISGRGKRWEEVAAKDIKIQIPPMTFQTPLGRSMESRNGSLAFTIP
jgi:hypothetical protein